MLVRCAPDGKPLRALHAVARPLMAWEASRTISVYVLNMTPRARPAAQAPRLVSPAPEDEARVREAFAESLRDEGRALTPEELRRWVETGEWPES